MQFFNSKLLKQKKEGFLFKTEPNLFALQKKIILNIAMWMLGTSLHIVAFC